MNTATLTRHALCAAAVALSSLSQAQTATSPPGPFELAMADYERQQYSSHSRPFGSSPTRAMPKRRASRC